MRALGLVRVAGGMIFMLGKKGEVAVNETLKWIIYIAVLVAASLGVWKVVGSVFG